jgi:catechol-2,3-dioxygenase
VSGIRRLNHAVLFVSDLERSLEFYTGVLGFQVLSREPRMRAAFLRTAESTNHHDLGLFGIGDQGGPRPRPQIGLYHLAWQVDTLDELVELRKTLLESGSMTGESSHGATLSLYGADPDGNEFEIMWMLPRSAWGEHETQAVVERLDLRAEMARWSGVSTADETYTAGQG